MTKSTAVKITDLLSFMSLSLMLSTGVLIRYSLPPRSGGNSLLGLTRHEWGDIHYYISILFLLLMSVHLFMHIGFIKRAIVGRVEREVKYRLAIGVLALAMLIALLTAPFFVKVDSGGRGSGKASAVLTGEHIEQKVVDRGEA